MPKPADNEDEWVEIYNDNDFSVDLIDWYIDDEEGKSSPKKFSKEIEAKSLAVIEMDSMFNNSGDEVRLLNHDQLEKDNKLYDYSEEGITWAYVYGSWCQAEPTKGEANQDCRAVDEPTSTPTKKPTETPKETSTPTPTETLTPTPSPKKSPTPTQEVSPTPIPTLSDSDNDLEVSGPGDVLGETSQKEPRDKGKLIAGGFIGMGGLLLGGVGFGPKIKELFDKMKNDEKGNQVS